LKEVLKACTQENQFTFSDAQLDQLAMNMYQDAVIDETADSNVICVYEGLGYEQLKAQMMRHPGLLDNLSIWSVLGSKSSNSLKRLNQ